MILPRKVVQRGLQRAGSLVKGLVADRMHFDLQTGAICLLAEVNNLFVRIIQNAVTALGVDIGLLHGGIV